MPGTSRRGRVTRADVARLAGVSVATVSYVLNDRKALPEATKQKVFKAVEELGYFPDLVARSMSSNESKQLGYISTNIDNPFYAAVLAGVEEEARTKGCTVIMSVMHERDDGIIRSFIGRRVDGVVCSGSLYSAGDMQLFLQAGIPISTVGYDLIGPRDVPVTSIVADYAEGTRLAVEHLVGLGHVSIGLLPGNDVGGRLNGWLNALADHGLEPAAVAVGDYTYAGGLGVSDLLLDSDATAILVGNDFMALALMNRAARRGIRIPEDLSVIGFDDIWMSERNVPSLTTVNTSPAHMGRVAASTVLDPPASVDFRAVIRTPVGLVVRESTGPAPKKP